jgi:hypothetical protein
VGTSSAEEPSIPFLTKELKTIEDKKAGTLLVKIYAPSIEGDLYRCTYELWVDGSLERNSSVTGGDAVHALLLALWKIEADLTHRSPFNSLAIQHDASMGLGFIHSKRVWDSVYKS